MIIFGARFYLVQKISYVDAIIVRHYWCVGVVTKKFLQQLQQHQRAKYDGLLIFGDFNFPSLSWSIESLSFPNTLSPGSSVRKLYCDVFVSLGLFQNVKETLNLSQT